MMKQQLRSARLEELIEAYKSHARTQGAATESGDYKVGNEASDMLSEIYGEIRQRGSDAQRELLPLLKENDPGIRLWSASHALEFSPDDGEPVLRSLIPVGTFLGLCARTTLLEWEKGRLQFP